MRREGQKSIVETPREALNLAVSAACVLDDKQLWRTPEIGELWEIGETQDTSQLPLELSVGATRKIVRGLRADVARPLTEGGLTSTNVARVRAGIYLMQLDLPRVAGR
jgi:hypothetical protein